MTVDERLEFLLKSTESLHVSVHELYSSMGEVRASVQSLRATAEEHTKQFAIQAETIRQLAIIAAAHGDRISSLERKTGT
jgi:hypothetical protein